MYIENRSIMDVKRCVIQHSQDYSSYLYNSSWEYIYSTSLSQPGPAGRGESEFGPFVCLCCVEFGCHSKSCVAGFVWRRCLCGSLCCCCVCGRGVGCSSNRFVSCFEPTTFPPLNKSSTMPVEVNSTVSVCILCVGVCMGRLLC
jgi:hypothetical protein